jgi:hypothetical protein
MSLVPHKKLLPNIKIPAYCVNCGAKLSLDNICVKCCLEYTEEGIYDTAEVVRELNNKIAKINKDIKQLTNDCKHKWLPTGRAEKKKVDWVDCGYGLDRHYSDFVEHDEFKCPYCLSIKFIETKKSNG